MRVLIAAGGEKPSKELLERYLDVQLVIAADSGADWLYQYGVTPDAILGDMDSVTPIAREHFESKGVRFLKYPSEKNATDTMIAANYAVAGGATEVILLGAGGGRPDHMYANYQVLAYLTGEGVRALMPCKDCVCCMCNSSIELKVYKGQTVSILPFGGDIRVTSISGELKYPVDRLLIPVLNPDPCGVSNVALKNKLHLQIEGMALIILNDIAINVN